MDNAPTRILVIEDNPADARLLRETLLEVAGGSVDLWWADRLSSGLKQLAQTDMDVVLLDLSLPDSKGFETFSKLRAQAPDLPVIVITGLDDEAVALRAAREGAQDYLVKGSVNPQSMARCIRFAIERHKTLAQSSPEHRGRESGRVLGFLGAKGGVGTTTVALNVAAILAHQGKSVIALELRSYFGAFSLQFQRAPSGNLRDLLDMDAGQIDGRALKRRLVSLPGGVKALFGPQTADHFKEIQPQQAEAIVSAAAGMADYVIVDLPSHPCDASQSAAGSCSFMMLVVEREPVCVGAGKVMVALLRSWMGRNPGLGAVVVTRNSLSSPLKLPDIQVQLGCPIVGVIPPAAELCANSYQSGVPLALDEPDSIAAANLTDLANRLAEPALVPVSV
jgi:MinD-like ATPase involved in chromosome partitioning or flagellar assembly/ActR/RegA family two-component response regulator